MIIFSVFSLSSCGESETQQILTDISSYQSTFEIALYDGGNIVRTYFPGTIDLEKRKELVEKLSTAGAETVLPKNIKAPFYEVMLCKEDGNSYALKWASGYVVTEGGKVYKKNIDFESLMKEYDYHETTSERAEYYFQFYLEGVFYEFMKPQDVWNIQYLQKEPEYPPAEGLTLKLEENTDEGIQKTYGRALHGIIENQSGQSWRTAEYILQFHLSVYEKGTWYCVPLLPDAPNLIDSDDITVAAGETLERYYMIETVYGKLPAGRYKIREYNGPSAELDISYKKDGSMTFNFR